jgi:predicted AlkP superfamily phosphohydrolase/phosphomutase
VIFIALDASEPRLLHRWIRSGDLPFLASIDASGHGTPIRNLKGFGDGVFWPCASTGVNPARHGRMFSSRFDSRAYRSMDVDDDQEICADQFWEILDRLGLRTATVDVVHAALRPLQHGVMICDWMTHERQGIARSYPPSLIESLSNQYGEDPVGGSADAFIIETRDYPELIRRLDTRLESKTRALEELIRSQPWDVFTCSFGEPHDIGHMCWHLHDPGHPKFDAALAARLGNPVLETYKALDNTLQRLCDAAGDDARIVILAGPGMDRMNTFNRSLDRVLLRLEERHSGSAPVARRPRQTPLRRRLSKLWRAYVPRALRSQVAKSALLGQAYSQFSQRVRQDRLFFAQSHNANAGAVRVNLVGREANGKVRPGDELEQLLAWLTREFKLIVDGQGRPLVSDIAYPTTEYRGPYVDRLCDMLIIWNREADLTNLSSPTIGPISDTEDIPRTGDHTPDGYLWISGHDIALQRGERRVTPMDIAPTLLAMLGRHGFELEGQSLLAADIEPSVTGRHPIDDQRPQTETIQNKQQ